MPLTRGTAYKQVDLSTKLSYLLINECGGRDEIIQTAREISLIPDKIIYRLRARNQGGEMGLHKL